MDRTEIYFGSANGTFTLSSFQTRFFDIHGVAVAKSTAYSRNKLLAISVGGGRGSFLKSGEIYFVTPERKFVDISNRIGLGAQEGRGRTIVFLDMALRNRQMGRQNGGGPDILYNNFLGRSTTLKQFGYENVEGTFRLRSVGGFANEREGRTEVTDVEGDGVMEVIAIFDLRIYKLVAPFQLEDWSKWYVPQDLGLGVMTVSSVAELDFDNDGDFDLYVARARRSLISAFRDRAGGRERDLLLENVGGRYVDVTSEAGGVGGTGDSTGVTVGDFDNDGYVDIYLSQYRGKDVLLRNMGNGRFQRELASTKKPRRTVGNHAVAVDYDLDGRVDVIVGQGDVRVIRGYYRLMKNVFQGGAGYLLITVGSAVRRGATALHAVASVQVEGKGKMSRRVGSRGAQGGGGSYLETLHFGLGKAMMADVVAVKWSNGEVETRRNVDRNQRLYFGVFV